MHKTKAPRRRRSIFRSLFVPLLLIMALQAGCFYLAAVYGGIEETLNQNAIDILSERLENRKNELESLFNGKWTKLDDCGAAVKDTYAQYTQQHGEMPLTFPKNQVQFLSDTAPQLIDTLRRNEVNGIFLILNDRDGYTNFFDGVTEHRYGLCIRDMDPDSGYVGTEDLMLERAPSSTVDSIGCVLDSWWEARYSFTSEEQGDFYYVPLKTAWKDMNPDADENDYAYCSGVYHLSGSDQAVVSYSIPLLDSNGYPFGVLGVEITTKYIASLLPNRELNESDKCCYILAQYDKATETCTPLVGTGTLYTRNFSGDCEIFCGANASVNGFRLTGLGDVALYGDTAELNIYNAESRFSERGLTLLAIVEEDTLFEYIGRVKFTLFLVTVFTLLIGMAGIMLASRRFAAPITQLAKDVSGMDPSKDMSLGRLGISEIDLLVDSIEELNRNVSKTSARTEFFSRMSHDMRTPMNAIISFSSPELLEGVSEAEKDDYLEKIHASGSYLLSLINEVLDMTKIESNKTQLIPTPVAADELCGIALPIVEKLAESKKVALVSDVPKDSDLYVMVDSPHFNQILLNLLSNAVKFTPEYGRVSLTVTLTPYESNPDKLKCRMLVADNGIGMSESFMKNLYTPFEQENSRKEGTGLGLAITKKLVELMGGNIECYSRQGLGTSFVVVLPLPKGVAPQQPLKSENSSAEVSLEGKRVLICEDNALNTQIVSHLLVKKGMTVEAACDGEEGVMAFKTSSPGRFDVILMDMQMPVMNGLDATRAIRALERPDAKTIPIIAMTANAFEKDVQACLEAGMNAHLSKPIEPAKVYDTLRKYLR